MMNTTLRLAALAALSAAVAAPALAGGFAEPIATPVVTPVTIVPPPVSFGGNWSGGYIGLEASGAQLSFDDEEDLDGLDAEDFDGSLYGIHAGYRRDLGRFVLGGELAYTTGSFDLEAPGFASSDIDLDVIRAGVQLGYDAGRLLPYVSAGGLAASLDSDVIPDGDYDTSGYYAGVGVDYAITERFSIGGQYLYQDLNADDAEFDFTAPSLGVRTTYNF